MITANLAPAAHAGEAQASSTLAGHQAYWESVELHLMSELGLSAAAAALVPLQPSAPAVIGGAK